MIEDKEKNGPQIVGSFLCIGLVVEYIFAKHVKSFVRIISLISKSIDLFHHLEHNGQSTFTCRRHNACGFSMFEGGK